MSNIKNVVGKPTVVADGMRVISQTLIDGANDWTSGNSPPVVHLYSNDPPITPALVLGDLVECAFSGYAEVSLDSLTAANDGDDVPILQNDFLAQFELTAADTLDSATGYFITDQAGDSLIGAERFDEGFGFDDIGDQVNLTPVIKMPGYTP